MGRIIKDTGYIGAISVWVIAVWVMFGIMPENPVKKEMAAAIAGPAALALAFSIPLLIMGALGNAMQKRERKTEEYRSHKSDDIQALRDEVRELKEVLQNREDSS